MATYKIDTIDDTLDLDADEVFEGLDDDDISDLIDIFREEEYLTEFDIENDNLSYFDLCLLSLVGKKHLLSKEDEDKILEISKSFIY